jgi:hypothetical protein
MLTLPLADKFDVNPVSVSELLHDAYPVPGSMLSNLFDCFSACQRGLRFFPVPMPENLNLYTWPF